MNLQPLSRLLWVFLACLTLISCSEDIDIGDYIPPASPDETPGLPDETPDAPDETPDETPDAPSDPSPDETPAAPEDPNGDEPIAIPNDLTPTLIKTYYVLETKEHEGEKELTKNSRNITYRPLNKYGWDILELKRSRVNRSQKDDPENWNRQDWLNLNLNRAATIVVVWQGAEIPDWLSSWQEVDATEEGTRTFEQVFSGDETVQLGRGEEKGHYSLLIGEADGSKPITPALPDGISERPVPNERCPDWVHDQYVAEHPDDGRIYRIWHPSIDPVYWCYFEHEHGSDPALANYTAYFGYTAAKNNNEAERHEGFKGFAFKDGETNWYVNAHFTTGLDTRACIQFHTVVFAATDANGELLTELSFKGDFGETRANRGDRAIITNASCPQEEVELADTAAEKTIRVLNQDGYVNDGYERWSFIGQAFLGLEARRIDLDTRNPVTGCDGLSCESFVPTDPNLNGDVRTLNFRGALTLRYNEESDKSDGKEDGYFYTDAKGSKYLDASDENAVRQYVSRDLSIEDTEEFERFGTRDPWRGLYSRETERFISGFMIENSIGPLN